MPARILLVDDEHTSLDAVASALSAAEFEVVRARSAKGAARLVETRQYLVVCCEMSLGGGGGHEFLARSAHAAPGISLLLIASSEELRPTPTEESPRSKRRTSSSDKVPGMRVLLKPFDGDQLVATVTHLARMADMRKSTHAMASVVAGQNDETDEEPMRLTEPPPPRSLPRKT